MTAIAYRAGVMAADTACWGGDHSSVIVGHKQKIIRLPGGALFAGAGRASDLARVAAQLAAGQPLEILPALKDQRFNAILVKPDGTAWWIEDDLLQVRQLSDFIACGAPLVFMLGALCAGASAEQAVRLAIQHTDGAAGTVQVEKLAP